MATTTKDGNNFITIRYAEVLLGYLEAKLQGGAPVDQALLDATINKVRGRAAIKMPAVTTTDPVAHRTVLRRVESAFEGLRWGVIAFENQK